MRLKATTAAAIAAALLSAPVAPAAVPAPPRVHATTGAATSVATNGALLTGSVDAKGQHVSYYFRWGPTRTLALQTPVTVDPKPELPTPLHVGHVISGLLPGTTYYYKLIVVLPTGGTIEGAERLFVTKTNRLKFIVPHAFHATYGTPFLLSGIFEGTGNAGVSIELQASPFPYLESFTPIGRPAVTTNSGAFSFRVANLTTSTQLRLMANMPLPVLSPVVQVTVQPRVIMHVRASSQPGLVRIYGTISPSVRSGKVLIQVQKATRPHGPTESTVIWATQFSTVTKKGVGNVSRFSLIAKIRRKGRYRVYLQLPRGGSLASGTSTTSAVLRP